MKKQTFHFLCGEEAVKTYYNLMLIEDMNEEQHSTLVDWGSLDILYVNEQTTVEDLIAMIIMIHNGHDSITLITENEYNFLKQKGV
jgi:hypothetical protein